MNKKIKSCIKAIFIITLIFLITATAMTQDKNQSQTEQSALYETAFNSMIQGDYNLAIQGFLKCVKKNPKDAESYANLASCYMETNNYKNAAKASKKAAQNWKNAYFHDDKATFRTDALVLQGEAYLSQEFYSLAQKKFLSVYMEDVTNKHVFLNIIATYMRHNKVQDAVVFCAECYERVQKSRHITEEDKRTAYEIILFYQDQIS